VYEREREREKERACERERKRASENEIEGEREKATSSNACVTPPFASPVPHAHVYNPGAHNLCREHVCDTLPSTSPVSCYSVLLFMCVNQWWVPLHHKREALESLAHACLRERCSRMIERDCCSVLQGLKVICMWWLFCANSRGRAMSLRDATNMSIIHDACASLAKMHLRASLKHVMF